MKFIEKAKKTYLSGMSLFSVSSREEIWRMSQAKNSEIRCWVAKALSVDAEKTDVCEVLCFLSKDSDTLVRIEAIDSLSNSISYKAYQCLLSAASDSDELVRAYAAYGLACVGQYVEHSDAQHFLLEMLEREKSTRTRVGIMEALYLLGDDKYLPELLQIFESDDYLVRCSVIQALCEIANHTNYTMLESFVANIHFEAEIPAVMSAITQLLGILDSLKNEI